MGKTVTFLQLAEEFGGTKFGPFEAVEIRLGSDPDRNDVSLPASLGVAVEHVKILKQQDGSFIIAPVERTAAVFFFRGSGGRAKQITAPLACRSGDGFALVTPEGPRFYIQNESNPQEIAKKAEEAQGPGLDFSKSPIRAGSLWREVKRRGFAAVFTTRLGNWSMTAWRMFSTGQLFSPVYIVGGLLMLSGWFFAVPATCGAMNMRRGSNDLAAELRATKDQCGQFDDDDEDGGGTDPSVAQLTRTILLDDDWKTSLEKDGKLREAYAQELKAVFGAKDRYAWVYTKKRSDFVRFKAAIEKQVPAPVARVLAYAAAEPGRTDEWKRTHNSEDKDVCGRGPLHLTYREAYNLGLGTLQPDALINRDLADSNDEVKLRAELDRTLALADNVYEYRDDLITVQPIETQGGLYCVFVDGEDERTDIGKLARAIGSAVGSSSKEVPKEGFNYWASGRIVRYSVQDFPKYDLDNAILSTNNVPSTELKVREIGDSQVRFAMNKTAKLMARAAAIPCLARMESKQSPPVPTWLVDPAPGLGSCAILDAFIRYDNI